MLFQDHKSASSCSCTINQISWTSHPNTAHQQRKPQPQQLQHFKLPASFEFTTHFSHKEAGGVGSAMVELWQPGARW